MSQHFFSICLENDVSDPPSNSDMSVLRVYLPSLSPLTISSHISPFQCSHSYHSLCVAEVIRHGYTYVYSYGQFSSFLGYPGTSCPACRSGLRPEFHPPSLSHITSILGTRMRPPHPLDDNVPPPPMTCVLSCLMISFQA